MDRKRSGGTMSRRTIAKLAAGAATAALGMPAVIRAQGSAVKLSFFYPVSVAGPLAKIMQGMVDDFNKANPDIQVNASFTGSYQDTTTKVQTAVNGKNPPDVAVLLATDLQTMLDLKAIVPVSDFTPGPEFDPKDFQPAFFQDTQIDGKTWNVPFQRSTPILYYNKDALKAAGGDPDKPPQTWEELVATSKKTMGASSAKWGVEFPTSQFAYWQFQALVIESGSDLNGEDHAHFTFDTPEATEALTWLVGLSKTEKVMPDGVIDWSAAPTDFSGGTTAFLYHSTGSLRSILSQAKFEVGTAFLPKNKQFGTPTGGGSMYLFKDRPQANQEAAWTFIRWMTAPAQATRWSLATGYVPVRISSTKSKEWLDSLKETPQANTAIEQLQYAKPELTGHQSGQIQKIMDDNIQAAVSGQKQPADALKNAQQQADAILKQFR